MEDKLNKKNSKSKIILMLSLIIIIIILGLIIYKVFILNNKKDNYKNEVEEVETDENYKYKLDIYKSKNGYLCQTLDNDCTEVAFSIKVKSEDAKLINFTLDDSYLLYTDSNTLFIYDVKSQEKIKTKLEPIYQEYDVIHYNNQILGITYVKEDENGYFNLKTNQKMYKNKYASIISLNSTYLTGIRENGMMSLLKIDKQEEETEFPKDINNLDIDELKFKDKKYYIISPDSEIEGYPYAIFDNNKKLLSANLTYDNYNFYNEYLYISDNQTLKKYDIDGNLITSISNIKGEIKQVSKNYALYIDSKNYLNLINIDTKEEKQITKFDSEKYNFGFMSGYYTKEELENIDNGKEEGYYIMLYYNYNRYEDGKDENGNYGIEYCYQKDGNIKTYDIKVAEGGRDKPVLYLYPPKETNIKVEFSNPEYLTTTYPKYKDKWEVKAYPNGDLYDNNNKYYYALYWDEVRYHEVDFQEGFYVEGEKAIAFLEEKLSLIGLNSREKNEFIMYFLPILEKNQKSLVYFELTKEREKYNKLIITPKPDSLLRVTIHIKKVNQKINIKEEKLETFKRIGFSAVEWGGMTY